MHADCNIHMRLIQKNRYNTSDLNIIRAEGLGGLRHLVLSPLSRPPCDVTVTSQGPLIFVLYISMVTSPPLVAAPNLPSPPASYPPDGEVEP